MNIFTVLILFLSLFCWVESKVIQEVPDLTRRIHGSYGSFRDFAVTDCDRPHESEWMRCSNNETPAFAYHWNNKLKGCERVLYKGCGASRNNFVTERDCNKQAKIVCS
ncbi:kunitz-type serine protease inhibitor BmKTT-2-like [Euwallacea similis]|uniref:kunitz-type serine protease inhibitor BmKTT-2-like n=1 Tax=Euwallacea similis TaxID=1736056 RepID=UPI0034505062